jgi:hypothetical protein
MATGISLQQMMKAAGILVYVNQLMQSHCAACSTADTAVHLVHMAVCQTQQLCFNSGCKHTAH